MNEETQTSQANQASIPPSNERGLRLYNRPYTEKLLETLAHEAGFPVIFQADQFERLLALLFERRLAICKIYDDESWTQISHAWNEKRHFHMFPNWKKPEPVAVPVPSPVAVPVPANPIP
jgi:hypothetical protein